MQSDHIIKMPGFKGLSNNDINFFYQESLEGDMTRMQDKTQFLD